MNLEVQMRTSHMAEFTGVATSEIRDHLPTFTVVLDRCSAIVVSPAQGPGGQMNATVRRVTAYVGRSASAERVLAMIKGARLRA